MALIVGLYVMVAQHDASCLTLMGQYTVSNYSSQNGDYKVFLLSKQKLNFTVLENENDITDKLLVIRFTA